MSYTNFKHLGYLFYLSLCGALTVLGAQRFAGTPVLFWPVFPSFAVIFAIYTINRYSDAEEDRINNPSALDYFSRNKGILYASVIMLAITYALLWEFGQLAAQYIILLCAGMAYSWRIIPLPKSWKRWRLTRIKDMPAMKNITVALLWGTSIFIVPLSAHHYNPWNDPRLVSMMLAFSISTWSNAFFNDILDRDGDAASGNSTIAVMLGIPHSLHLIAWLNEIWLLISLFLFWQNIINPANLIFITLLIAIPIIAILCLSRRWMSESRLRVLSEADLPVMASGLFLLR